MEPTADVPGRGFRALWVVALTLAGLVVFGWLTPVFPIDLRLPILVAACLASLALALAFRRRPELHGYWRLPFLYFIASSALLVSEYAGDWVLALSRLRVTSVWGFAVFKFAEDAAILGTIAILAFLSRDRPAELYLCKGDLGRGLATGLSIFFLLTALGFPRSLDQGFAPETALGFLPPLALMALADGFMEELLFRGLFLKRFGRLIGPAWANVVTATLFAYVHIGAPHLTNLIVGLPLIFLMGLLLGWVMQKTGSVLAPALIHAGGLMLSLGDMLGAYGVEL